MITLNSEHPPVAIYYIPMDKSDFMGCLQLHLTKPRVYTFDFRFRYYKDDLVFDSEDTKSWYHLETEKSTEEDVIAKIRSVVLRLADMVAHDDPTVTYTEMLYSNYRSFREFFEAFANQPWAFAKVGTKEDLEKYQLQPTKS